jgi:hypothetical protein
VAKSVYAQHLKCCSFKECGFESRLAHQHKFMTDYTILAKFRSKDLCEELVKELEKRNKTCYNFCTKPADPKKPESSPEEQMKTFEKTKDFFDNPYFKEVFETDLDGLKNAKNVIVLLPAGNSVHIEAGIAFGLGKNLILIGKPEKPESLYLIFKERHNTIADFLNSLN